MKHDQDQGLIKISLLVTGIIFSLAQLIFHDFLDFMTYSRSSHPEVFCKKGILKKFRKIHRKIPVPEFLFRPQVCIFIKKETLAQVFSYEFCKIFKNTFFTEHFRTTASDTHNVF